jgi:hypothetical protein
VKTILIIDGADNCAYDCFGTDDKLFKVIFPNVGQDIEFIEDFLERAPGDEHEILFAKMWDTPIDKKEVAGIDGILFYGLLRKKIYYPNKRDSDLNGIGRKQRD